MKRSCQGNIPVQREKGNFFQLVCLYLFSRVLVNKNTLNYYVNASLLQFPQILELGAKTSQIMETHQDQDMVGSLNYIYKKRL